MLAIFLFAGIGNASTFKQMPMIFERRQAGGVIGWTAAIAAFGPFFFGVGLTTLGPAAFYSIGIAWAVMCVGITWVRYARRAPPSPADPPNPRPCLPLQGRAVARATRTAPAPSVGSGPFSSTGCPRLSG